MTSPLDVYQRRVVRLMADRLLRVLDERGATRVLLASARESSGRTTLAQELARDLDERFPERFLFLGGHQLAGYAPAAVGTDTTVVVDGPPMMDGLASLKIPQTWVEALDGAILLVMGHETSRADVQDAAARLRAAGIPPIGVVWNEYARPPSQYVTTHMRHRLGKLRAWVPTLRRSSHSERTPK